MAYELSKSLPYKTVDVQTVLGQSSINVVKNPPVFVTIIRAGLPFLEGFQHFFEESECGFIAAQRVEGNKEDITIDLHYSSIPSFENRDLVIVDPMLATGNSLLASLEQVLSLGSPNMLHCVSAIAAAEGIDNIKTNLKIPYKLWVGAVDEELNHSGYIVPGLGDAGDLLYGNKI
jgi:uracil phosphoribosyltransferase